MEPSILFLIALIGPGSYAIANICDHQLSMSFGKDHTFQISISKILQALFALPVLMYISRDVHLDRTSLLLIGLCASLEFLYVYPYLWSFEGADTSVVVALFSLGKVFVPILAWVTLGEVLGVEQYLGFALIIASGVFLTFDFRNFRLNRAAGHMFSASLLLAVINVATKSALDRGLSWGSFTVASMTLEGFLGLCFLIVRWPRARRHFETVNRKIVTLIFAEGCASTIGFASVVLAMSLLPVSVTKGVGGLQPLFVLLFARILAKFDADFALEGFSGISMVRKCLTFGLMIIGTVMTMS